jgi:hypothetical protein
MLEGPRVFCVDLTGAVILHANIHQKLTSNKTVVDFSKIEGVQRKCMMNTTEFDTTQFKNPIRREFHNDEVFASRTLAIEALMRSFETQTYKNKLYQKIWEDQLKKEL